MSEDLTCAGMSSLPSSSCLYILPSGAIRSRESFGVDAGGGWGGGNIGWGGPFGRAQPIPLLSAASGPLSSSSWRDPHPPPPPGLTLRSSSTSGLAFSLMVRDALVWRIKMLASPTWCACVWIGKGRSR
jgi:hypothetical protein